MQGYALCSTISAHNIKLIYVSRDDDEFCVFINDIHT